MSDFDFNKLGDILSGVVTLLGVAAKVAGTAIEVAQVNAARAREILDQATASLRTAEIDLASVLKKNDATIDAEVAAHRSEHREGGGGS